MQEFESPPARRSPAPPCARRTCAGRAGVLVLAMRHVDGAFTTNPDPDT